MKRILLACLLLTATVTFVSRSFAQTTAVSASDFTAKTNLMDAQIASGDMTAAQATWDVLNHMMRTELGITKSNIMNATTPTDKAAASTVNRNQVSIYKTIWALKSNLPINRTAIHTQLGQFAATL